MPIECSIWQLADDADTYGTHAAHFIITTPDGEDEMTSLIFYDVETANAYAARMGWTIVPLEDHIGPLSLRAYSTSSPSRLNSCAAGAACLATRTTSMTNGTCAPSRNTTMGTSSSMPTTPLAGPSIGPSS